MSNNSPSEDTLTITGTVVFNCQRSHTGPCVVPYGASAIGDRAFTLCDSLTDITIPDSVTEIGQSAFSLCTSLIDVTIPDSVRSIGDRAFADCSGLEKIRFCGENTRIGCNAFSGCMRLAAAIVPNGCVFEPDAFPESCTVFPTEAAYRRSLAAKIVAEREDDGVDAVGMHLPSEAYSVVDDRGVRSIHAP